MSKSSTDSEFKVDVSLKWTDGSQLLMFMVNSREKHVVVPLNDKVRPYVIHVHSNRDVIGVSLSVDGVVDEVIYTCKRGKCFNHREFCGGQLAFAAMKTADDHALAVDANRLNDIGRIVLTFYEVIPCEPYKKIVIFHKTKVQCTESASAIESDINKKIAVNTVVLPLSDTNGTKPAETGSPKEITLNSEFKAVSTVVLIYATEDNFILSGTLSARLPPLVSAGTKHPRRAIENVHPTSKSN